MPEGQGSANLVGKRAYMLLSIPVSVLSGFDDDGNGLLSLAEYRVHGRDMAEQVDRRVIVDNGSRPGKTIYQDLLVPHSDSGATETTSITIMRISEWDSTVTALALHADVFPARGKSGPHELVFRTIRGDTAEVAILNRAKADARFFLPPLPKQPVMPMGQAALILAGLTAALLAAAVLVRRRAQSVASSLSSAA